MSRVVAHGLGVRVVTVRRRRLVLRDFDSDQGLTQLDFYSILLHLISLGDRLHRHLLRFLRITLESENAPQERHLRPSSKATLLIPLFVTQPSRFALVWHSYAAPHMSSGVTQ